MWTVSCLEYWEQSKVYLCLSIILGLINYEQIKISIRIHGLIQAHDLLFFHTINSNFLWNQNYLLPMISIPYAKRF